MPAAAGVAQAVPSASADCRPVGLYRLDAVLPAVCRDPRRVPSGASYLFQIMRGQGRAGGAWQGGGALVLALTSHDTLAPSHRGGSAI